MREDREQAIKLRLGGKSYKQISDAIHVPKSTLSSWLSEIAISDLARSKISTRNREKSRVGLLRHNQNQTKLAQERARNIRNKGSQEIESLSKRDLCLIGASLYWAEGYKRPIIRKGKGVTYHKISLTNSDPYLVKIFLRFLREYCAVPNDKIRANLRLFSHQNEKFLLAFWVKETSIQKQHFNKVYYGISKSSLGKRPFNRLPYGVVQVVVSDTNLFHKIMGYIDGLKKFV